VDSFIFYAGKVLTALATPLALCLLALLYAGFSRRRASRIACFAAAVLLVLFGSEFGSGLILRTLENRYKADTADSAPTAPAIVVLGGGLANINDPAGVVELGGSSERLWTAVELYRAGKSPLILISGGNAFRNTKSNVAESALAARILQDWGVPPSAILTEEESKETHQNAVFSRRILAQRGISSILLVTSAFHMPRAYATFRRAGFTVFPVPSDYITGGYEDHGILLSLLPNTGSLTGSGIAIKEWLGIVAYRLRGWAI
jgi:uncharacterized SAM-binding protein YcdF (DUF218 family)